MIKKLTFYKIDSSFDEFMRERLVLEAIETKEGNIVPGLRKIGGKNCIFYKQPNCTVYSSRPKACRNYPFAFARKKEHIEVLLAKDAKRDCIGIGKGPLLPISGLYKQGQNTLREIDLHNDFIEELNIEAGKGNPLSARETIWMFIVYGEKFVSTQ
jgi:Fe-S-cluster containining protein